MSDEVYIERAISLAERGRGLVSPNPMVGAVLVASDGRVAGEGWHEGPGTPHAEIRALEQAGARARGATLFTSLEPCDHFGRTGPCTDAIVAAGIGRVVSAMRDPNPIVDGRGFAKLQAQGI
ncbi:MAG: bifunctional diaminohydroxyphosphoribosylaminopyrimidine deaminase/5-amino-6-(5-phosphoribosylamino)uracil reductase RibD, partial [Actinomycetota bacterium]